MAASRFRSPKKWTLPERRQPRTGWGSAGLKHKTAGGISGVTPLPEFEREQGPVLRVSRTGLCNTPKKQQASLRKEHKADPKGAGVHSWRRRQW